MSFENLYIWNNLDILQMKEWIHFFIYKNFMKLKDRPSNSNENSVAELWCT